MKRQKYYRMMRILHFKPMRIKLLMLRIFNNWVFLQLNLLFFLMRINIIFLVLVTISLLINFEKKKEKINRKHTKSLDCSTVYFNIITSVSIG
jgi:hypothetical protein